MTHPMALWDLQKLTCCRSFMDEMKLSLERFNQNKNFCLIITDNKILLHFSRLSGGSTQSEVIPSDKKPKKGLLGKLKKLTKSSRSIDNERNAYSEVSTAHFLIVQVYFL